MRIQVFSYLDKLEAGLGNSLLAAIKSRCLSSLIVKFGLIQFRCPHPVAQQRCRQTHDLAGSIPSLRQPGHQTKVIK